jgi:two-component system sensor histidine kinase VicK
LITVLSPVMINDTFDNLPGDLFQVIFEKSPGSLLIKANEPHFTILAASDSYLKAIYLTRKEVLGKGFFEIFPDNDNATHKVFAKAVETRQETDIPVYRHDVFEPEINYKRPRYWSCSNTPILDDNNHVTYILNTIVDITNEIKAKEAAIESEKRLLLAAEATGMAIWDLAIPDLNFTFSAQLPGIFGQEADEHINLDSIRRQVHPDDMQEIVLKAYYDALATGQYFYEVRVFWPDQSLHWVRTKGIVLFNKNKEPVRMLGTILDITETKRDEIRKNDFIAMASHELKTPLTSLKAYLQLLEIKLAGTSDPFVKTAVAKSGKQVNKMTALIHNFLDISKLEPGKLQLNPTTFDINALIREIVSESRLLSNTHLLRFEHQGEINISADRQKIGQVISNFISNAIKYSPRGSHVTLKSEIKDDNLQVSVTDEGIGILLKEQEKIFQRFYRAQEVELKTVSGFGIGLYLSSEIIQCHQGKIWVTSEECEGSTFYFSLSLVTV